MVWVVWYVFSLVWASLQESGLVPDSRAGLHRNALWPLQLQVRFDKIKMSRGKLRGHEPDGSCDCSSENRSSSTTHTGLTVLSSWGK